MKIAVIGCAGYFPQAGTLEQFRQNLIVGKDSVRPVSDERRRHTSLPWDTDYPEFAFIEDIHSFDHRFFNISHGEAICMDPHQRLILQSAYHAIESAQMDPARMRGTNSAVYVADVELEYGKLAESDDPTLVTGTLNAATAGRLARSFDLRGRAMMIDTACSSGLVAVETACRDLDRGGADYALVSAASLRVIPPEARHASEIGIFSASGRSRSYSDSADGTGGGEAVATVLLQRHEDAVAHGNPIHAIVRGAAVNQDAARSGSLTAPDAAAQAEVINRAWVQGGIDPRRIRIIEGHGSGTKLGDPIEVQGLVRAFRKYTSDRQFCALSSVKSNIGHTDSAAGLVGFLKALLSVKHREIYPAVHFDTPNKMIDFATAPVYVSQHYEKLAEGQIMAGVSSFGLSGTNCHIVLESPGEPHQQEYQSTVFPVSANDPDALRNMAVELRSWLDINPGITPSTLSHVLLHGRPHMPHRLCLVASTRAELASGLDRIILDAVADEQFSTAKDKIIFCFSEAHDITPVMLEGLRNRYSSAENACIEAGFLPQDADDSAALRFAFQYALATIFKQYGIAYSTVVTDGTGKTVVSCIKGEITAAAGLAASRGQGYANPVSDDRIDNLIRKIGSRAVIIELGAMGSLSSSVHQRLIEKNGTSNVLCMTDGETVGAFFAKIFCTGVPIISHSSAGMPPLNLPGYPFRKTRCWLRPEQEDNHSRQSETSVIEWMASLDWQPDGEEISGDISFKGQVALLVAGAPEITKSVHEKLCVLGAKVVVVGESPACDSVSPTPTDTDMWRATIDGIEARYGQLDLVLDLTDYHPLQNSVTVRQAHAFMNLQFQQRLSMLQCLAGAFGRRGFRLIHVSAQANAVLEGEGVNPWAAIVATLYKSVLSEYVALDLRCIDLAYQPDQADIQARSILCEIAGDGIARFVSYRDARRYSQILNRCASGETAAFEYGGVVLVTGGAGGLGLAIAKHLAKKEPRRFILLGRRAPDEIDPSVLAEIEAQGSSVEYHQVDISDADAVNDMFKSLGPGLKNGFGIIHAAGIPGTWARAIHQKSMMDFDLTAAAKIQGTLNLYNSAPDGALRYFLAFSSLSTLVPPRHRADYACANAFLDAFAHHRASGKKPFTAVTWPAWEDFTMGMYDPELVAKDEALKAALTGLGFPMVDTATGLQLFDQIPFLDTTHTLFARVNEDALAFNPYFRLPESTRYTVNGTAPQEASVTEKTVWQIWSTVLRTSRLGLDDEFHALGGHSLIAVRITHMLEKRFACEFELSDLLTAPTIRQLAALVEQRLVAPEIASPIPALPDQSSYPLSSAQRRIWLATQLPGANIAYNEPSAYKIMGPMNMHMLRDAVGKIVERHEILRTFFETTNGILKQTVHASVPIDQIVSLVDFGKTDDPEGEAHRRIAELSGVPFDLTKTPLVKIEIMKTTTDETVVAIVSHHIISDGWSHKIFLRELLNLLSDQNPDGDSLPPLKIQYRDYASWERANIERHKRHLGFWRQELKGCKPLCLPVDRARPERKSYKGKRIPFAASRDVCAALVHVAKQNGVSMFGLNLALIGVLISLWSKQDDIIIATPVTGRDHSDLEPLIGCFINLMCLRIRIDTSGSLQELILEVGSKLPGWLSKQSCPYDLLFEDREINPDRIHNSLYETGFTWDSDETHAFTIGNASVTRIPVLIDTAKASLWFYGRLVDGRLEYEIEYDTELFTDETIGLLQHRFENLLAQVEMLLQQPIEAMNLMNASSPTSTSRKKVSLNL